MASADEERLEILERWDRGAAGWSRRADAVQEFGMRVSVWLVEHLDLQPGQRVLELAAGPGDSGFLAAELVKPGGQLISSDASRAMLGVATGRARDLGVTNVEFKLLELEWIDLPTASVDAVLCRWGLMFAVDPAAALTEMRRVIKPGGKVALSVWDAPAKNPWATVINRALVELGHADPPDLEAPGMFALADAERLGALLEDAGFVEPLVESVELRRTAASVGDFVEESVDLNAQLADLRAGLSPEQWTEVTERIVSLSAPSADGGGLSFPARALVAAGSA
ncbi:MAG TPA: methyltransferase domain-containing protein [Solirubrobacteraceae bacterium]|nr:methyltransferase domain-containing protein [Solirubrobacteraceae bacterium]